MNLIIDEGNTRVKCAIFDKTDLVEFDFFNTFDADAIQKRFSKYQLTNCIVCSTQNEKEFFTSFLESFSNGIFLDHTVSIPIENAYETPETLGKDRLAAVVAAHDMIKDTDILVIDAGTALTLEYLSKDGTYLGGTISPGLGMRFRALNQFTKKLPYVNPFFTNEVYGRNSKSAIQQGVYNSMLYELNMAIKIFRDNHKKASVVCTGGDIVFFEKKLKNTIFVIPNLVLIGLNTILEHNAY